MSEYNQSANTCKDSAPSCYPQASRSNNMIIIIIIIIYLVFQRSTRVDIELVNRLQ